MESYATLPHYKTKSGKVTTNDMAKNTSSNCLISTVHYIQFNSSNFKRNTIILKIGNYKCQLLSFTDMSKSRIAKLCLGSFASGRLTRAELRTGTLCTILGHENHHNSFDPYFIFTKAEFKWKNFLK